MPISQLLAYALLTLAVGFLGSLLAKKLKFPAAMMTGAMLLVLAYSLLSGIAYFPTGVKPVVQAVAGGAIGVTIDRKAMSGVKKLGVPIAVYILMLVVVACVAAAVIALLTPLTPATALLCSAPGGIVDMSMLSYEFDANTSQVTVLQMLRIVVAMGVFPTLTNAYIRRFGGETEAVESTDDPAVVPPVQSSLGNVLLTLLVMAVGGTLGYVLGIPAGTLSCAMIAVAAFQMKTGRAYMPPRFRRAAQVVAGTMIGAGMTMADLQGLTQLVLPFAIVVVEYLILNYVVGPWIARRWCLDLTTMLLACTPAGVSDMALIAGDMGGDQAKVAVFQICRLTSVLILFPYIVKLFALWTP